MSTPRLPYTRRTPPALQKEAGVGSQFKTLAAHGLGGSALGAGAGALAADEGSRLQGAALGGVLGAGAGLGAGHAGKKLTSKALDKGDDAMRFMNESGALASEAQGLRSSMAPLQAQADTLAGQIANDQRIARNALGKGRGARRAIDAAESRALSREKKRVALMDERAGLEGRVSALDDRVGGLDQQTDQALRQQRRLDLGAKAMIPAGAAGAAGLGAAGTGAYDALNDKKDSTETKQKLAAVFYNHSVRETASRFGVKQASLAGTAARVLGGAALGGGLGALAGGKDHRWSGAALGALGGGIGGGALGLRSIAQKGVANAGHAAEAAANNLKQVAAHNATAINPNMMPGVKDSISALRNFGGDYASRQAAQTAATHQAIQGVPKALGRVAAGAGLAGVGGAAALRALPSE